MLSHQLATGELSDIWRAGTTTSKRISRKLTESTDFQRIVQLLIQQYKPISMRVAAILLLGTARIYLRKCEFLANDSAGALTHIQRTEHERTRQTRQRKTTAREDRITLQSATSALDLGWEDVEREILDALGENACESVPNPGSTPGGAGLRLELETQFAGIETMLSQPMPELGDLTDGDTTPEMRRGSEFDFTRDSVTPRSRLLEQSRIDMPTEEFRHESMSTIALLDPETSMMGSVSATPGRRMNLTGLASPEKGRRVGRIRGGANLRLLEEAQIPSQPPKPPAPVRKKRDSSSSTSELRPQLISMRAPYFDKRTTISQAEIRRMSQSQVSADLLRSPDQFQGVRRKNALNSRLLQLFERAIGAPIPVFDKVSAVEMVETQLESDKSSPARDAQPDRAESFLDELESFHMPEIPAFEPRDSAGSDLVEFHSEDYVESVDVLAPDAEPDEDENEEARVEAVVSAVRRHGGRASFEALEPASRHTACVLFSSLLAASARGRLSLAQPAPFEDMQASLTRN
eukprot:gnl/Chilomastix_cuspidata/1208.p1 GENE.gnl/Chilomastix_cuspidata/1208~~gnl/Chilomastix_cuspidata/1208.p1  ORF type:complete len:547 (+),score=136.21 gnl/Chilomastix_cuspidata/1208:84-1643(+)